MQLNDQTDYGLRLLMTLGASGPQRWRTRKLAEVNGLSFSHVQKVVQSLEAAGFIETFRGRGGGVTLSRSADTITIGEVVRCLEPHSDLVRCFRTGDSGCVFDGGCALSSVLRRARSAFFAELDQVSLREVIDGTPTVRRVLAARG